MKTLLLYLTLTVTAWSQTQVPFPQLKWGGPVDHTTLRLFAVGLSEMTQVHIGPGLRMDLINGAPTLVAAPVTITRRPVKLTPDANGNYPGPTEGDVFRNGVYQFPGMDYTTNAGGILPVAFPDPNGQMRKWLPDDTVVAVVFETSPVASNPRAVPCSQWWRAPGCCTDPSQVKDCPSFYDLMPPQFQALVQAGVTPEQIKASNVAARTLVQTEQVRPREWYQGARFEAEPKVPGATPRTVVRHEQVRNWEMLRNPNSRGTSLAFNQLPMPADVADLWEGHARKPQYDEYRVAVVPTQNFPILITCTDGRCDQSWPLWFKSWPR